MCECCEPPYKEVRREWDYGLGETGSAGYRVRLGFREPMLLVHAYDSSDGVCEAGHVPARFCPMCSRDLRGSDG